MKTGIGLAQSAISRMGQGYIYGAFFDRIITQDYINKKAIQYPTQYTPNYIERSKKWIGHVAGDCVCLIKAFLWEKDGIVTYPADLEIRRRQDLSADGMFNAATVKGKIATIPEQAGVCVRYQGHVGVYIGNGEVVEARGVDYGVVKTKLKERGWVDWYLCPFIEYTEESGDIMITNSNVAKPEVYDLQTAYQELGYPLGNFKNMITPAVLDGRDGQYGGTCSGITKQIQKKYKLPETGDVDAITYGKIALDLVANGKAKILSSANEIAVLSQSLKSNAETFVIEKQNLEAKIFNNGTMIDYLTKQKDVLSKSLEDLQAAKKIVDVNLVAKATENTVLNSANAKMLQEKVSLIAEVGKAQISIKNIQDKLDTEISNNRALTENLDSMNEDLELVNEDLSAKNATIVVLEETQANLKSEIARVKGGFSEMTMGDIIGAIVTKIKEIWTKK